MTDKPVQEDGMLPPHNLLTHLSGRLGKLLDQYCPCRLQTNGNVSTSGANPRTSVCGLQSLTCFLSLLLLRCVLDSCMSSRTWFEQSCTSCEYLRKTGDRFCGWANGMLLHSDSLMDEHTAANARACVPSNISWQVEGAFPSLGEVT